MWVAGGQSIGQAWAQLDSVHAVSPCVDLHVVHIGSGSNAASRGDAIAGELPFRRVVAEQCTALAGCHVFAALQAELGAGTLDTSRTLVLLSSEPFCLAPAFLLLLEKLPDLQRRMDGPLTGMRLCQACARHGMNDVIAAGRGARAAAVA